MPASSPAPTQSAVLTCNGTTASNATPGPVPAPATNLIVPTGFRIDVIAHVSGARELAALPNGDLLVGTTGNQIEIVPNAEATTAAGTPQVFATINDSPAAGVTFVQQTCTVYAGTHSGIYTMPYSDGALTTSGSTQIASVRQFVTGGHSTTSVAFANGTLYASVGSSCNACTETDPTRATIQQMSPTGANMTARAINIRNAIALTVNPATGTVWAGDAGQDTLPEGHPFEFFDGVTQHAGVADYGWPSCEENHNNFGSGATCVAQVAPAVVLPAYSTIIGAVFYPMSISGAYAFPQIYRGGAFLAAHGSWHVFNGAFFAPPRVAFVHMIGDAPQTAVNWGDPNVQWSEFVGGFQLADGVTRIGRPTGLAVGSQGSLFIADDSAGVIYRVRPSTAILKAR
jgi:glucose/arabinose dehydrogenase